MKIILYHPQSGGYLYVHSEDAREILLLDGPLVDVTGDATHEELAKRALGPFNEGANLEAELETADIRTYFFTFQQSSPLRDNFVRVEGCDFWAARAVIREAFGSSWAFQYTANNFVPVGRCYVLREIDLQGNPVWPSASPSDEATS